METNFNLQLLTLNVRGIRDRVKRNNIFAWCKSKGGDIIFLQETYSTADVEQLWRSEWEGSMFFSHGTNHSRGTLILVSPNLKFKIDEILLDNEGRYILLKGELRKVKILLGNCYFPTRDKEKMQIEFLDKLDTHISKLYEPSNYLILGGDFNIIMNGKLDYMGPKDISKNKYNEKLEDLLRRLDLEDVWRKRHSDKKEFTYRQNWPMVQSRLDYWFCSSSMLKLVDKCDILTSITPDHSCVSLRLKNLADNFSFGKSYWKFNNSLCADPEFVNMLNNKIVELKEQLSSEIQDKLVLWDYLKMKLRNIIMKYSKEKAKQRRKEIEKLELEINNLENQLLNSPLKVIVDEIEEKRALLNSLHDYSRQGLKIRSRAEWSEEGETKTQYFEQLLKSNKRKSVIKEVYNENKDIITETNEILKIIKSFYEKLYSDCDVLEDINKIFLDEIPKLSEESKTFCEGKLTKNECYEVLKEMKVNKSPGNDGFTVEFYITFWPTLGETLVETLNEAYNRGELSTSQKQGVITLIEKEGKDSMHIKNYRPITLLNVDYKILSKILAKRIQEVLPEIIHHDQVGYMKKRNIGEAVRIIDDILFNSLTKPNGFLVAVDFEKAFDSVAHAFLFKILQRFGFGDSFRSWVKVLYTDISSCVMNGGNSTGYFKIKRGVRQGDPLSPYLFLLAIEILAGAIRKDNNITGFQFGHNEIKQIMYADDISLFVKDEQSIRRLQYTFDEFGKISGLKINKGKTNFLWLGEEKSIPDINLFGNFVQEIKILGIYFCLDVKVKENLNFKEILSKIKRLLGWWKERDLTLMGKIHLMKTFALSKLNYVSSLIVVPQWVFSEVEKITFEFLWNGKDRIKRNIMYQNYEFGGMKMTNFRLFVKAQRIMWLKRLLYGEKQVGWKLYFDFSFRTLGGRLLFMCDFDSSVLTCKAPPFYLEIVKAWLDIDKHRHAENDPLNPILFNNKHIRIAGKMFFYRDLYEAGICRVQDILDNGQLKPLPYFHTLGLCFKTDEVLKINDICNAIPKTWRESTTEGTFQKVDLTNFNLILKMSGQKTDLQLLKSRRIYEVMVKDLQSSYILHIKDDHNRYDYSDKEKRDIFIKPRNATLIRKHREFQFMLLHGAVYTRERLMDFGFELDNLCSFCQREPETYLHLFLQCDKVKSLWEFLINQFEIQDLRNMEWRDIFCGIAGNANRLRCVNSLIILMKYTIFRCKTGKKLPTKERLRKIVVDHINEEKHIATRLGKLHLHLQKWEYLDNTINEPE